MDKHELRLKNNLTESNERYASRELIVLLPIICLSLLQLRDPHYRIRQYHSAWYETETLYKSNAVIYLGTAIIPIALLYIAALIDICDGMVYICLHSGICYITSLICNILFHCGPIHLSLALFIEFIPQKYYTFVGGISFACFKGFATLFYNIPLYDHLPSYAFLLVFGTLSLVGVGLLCWLSPETSKNNLIEIEQQYLSRWYKENPDPEQHEMVSEELAR